MRMRKREGVLPGARKSKRKAQKSVWPALLTGHRGQWPAISFALFLLWHGYRGHAYNSYTDLVASWLSGVIYATETNLGGFSHDIKRLSAKLFLAVSDKLRRYCFYRTRICNIWWERSIQDKSVIISTLRLLITFLPVSSLISFSFSRIISTFLVWWTYWK